MADSTQAAGAARRRSSAAVSRADLERVQEFTREPILLEGEKLADLVPGSARRLAVDAALEEIEAGREEPSIEWRQDFSLLLGLERLLSEDDPQLADEARLSAHQVDALSGTLAALVTEIERVGANGSGSNGASAARAAAPDAEADGSNHVGGSEDDEEEVLEPDEEPQDWEEPGAVEEDLIEEAPEDPGAGRRFWFEHATGAGKTVAALGFVEASRTGGILILTHRRNLVDQFLGELRDRGYKKRVSPALLGRDKDATNGPVTVETYQW